VGFPAATPVTTPVEASTVANPVLELDHTPPDVPFVNVMVDPTHTDVGPTIEDTVGIASTVTPCVAVLVQLPLVTV